MNDARTLVPVEAQILDELRDLVAGRVAAGRRRRRRVRRRIAVGSAAAVIVAAGLLLPRGTSPLAPETASAASVLTAAARAAAAAPATDGTYWRVARRLRFTDAEGTGTVTRTEITWQDKAGRAWYVDDGHPTVTMRPPYGFSVCEDTVGYRQLATLPREPSALRARLARLRDTDRDAVVDPAVGVASCLVQLLASVPVPPGVRAAAWRALAGGTGIADRGETTDRSGRPGTELRFHEFGTLTDLVVDPSTGGLLQYDEVAPRGEKTLDTTILAAGWTDDPPVT